MQVFTVAYFVTMFFIGSVARTAWNYNDCMFRGWPPEIEKEAWSLERDEFLLVKEGWVYADGEYEQHTEFSRWSGFSVALWMIYGETEGFEDWWCYDENLVRHLLVVYSDMRVEYLDDRAQDTDRTAPFYLIQKLPSELEQLAGRLDYVGRSVPYHLLGEAGLWLMDKVPLVIMLMTVVWTVADVTSLRSTSAHLGNRRKK